MSAENEDEMARKTVEGCTFHRCEKRLANQRGSQNTSPGTRGPRSEIAEWLLLCLQDPKENPLVLRCSFPVWTYVPTMTDNPGSTVGRGPASATNEILV